MSENYIIVGIMSAVSLILVLVPLLMTVSRKKKLESYEYETDAVVTNMELQRMESRPTDNRSRMWVPTFQYSYGGHTYVHKSLVGMTEKTYEIGQTVPIKVSTQDPTRFVLVKSRAFTLATAILWVVAGFFIAGTVASAVLLQRLG